MNPSEELITRTDSLLSPPVCDELEQKTEAEPEVEADAKAKAKDEVALNSEQTRGIIAKFQAHVAELKQQLAAEQEKVEDAACFAKFTQQHLSKTMIDAVELKDKNNRLEEENAGYKRSERIEHGKFEDLLAAKMDLEKKLERRDQSITDLEDEVTKLKQSNEELRRGNAKRNKENAELVESKGLLRSSLDQAIAELDISRDVMMQASDAAKKILEKTDELEGGNTELKEKITHLEMDLSLCKKAVQDYKHELDKHRMG